MIWFRTDNWVENNLTPKTNHNLSLSFCSVLGVLFLLGSNSRFLVSFQFYMLILANCMSVYLGYLLYAVLKTMCVVCISTYGVNFLLLLLTYCRRNALRPKSKPEYLKSDWSKPGLPTSSRGGSTNFKKNIWCLWHWIERMKLSLW